MFKKGEKKNNSTDTSVACTNKYSSYAVFSCNNENRPFILKMPTKHTFQSVSEHFKMTS